MLAWGTVIEKSLYDVYCKLMLSLINTFKLCLCLLAVGFSPGNKVSEEDCAVDNLYMESKECAIVAYANAIDVAVSDKLLAIGDVFKAFGTLDFSHDSAQGVKHLARKLLDGLLEVLGVFYIHTPNQFSKSAFSCALSITCPSGRSLLSLAYIRASS